MGSTPPVLPQTRFGLRNFCPTAFVAPPCRLNLMKTYHITGKKKTLRARIRTFHLFEKFLFLPLPPLFGRCVLGADEPEPFEKKRKVKKSRGRKYIRYKQVLVFFLFHIWQLLDPRNMQDLRRARGISDWLIVTGFSLSICSSDE